MQIQREGESIEQDAIWEQRAKVSLECEECFDLLLSDIRKHWAEQGREIKIHYWTFLPGDREMNVVSLVCQSEAPANWYRKNRLMVTAPDDEIVEAIIWVIGKNSHLKFLDEKPRMGFNNDDFVHNRSTAVLNFEIK